MRPDAGKRARGAATRLVHVTTAPLTFVFLRGQAGYMRTRGMEVHGVSPPGPRLDAFGRQERATIHAIELTPGITPIQDLVAVVRLWRLFRRIRPHIVHAHTPKGGLLGMIAAAASRVPVRIYHLHGLPFDTATGCRRSLLQLTERVSAGLAHQVLCVSQSLRAAAIRSGVCRASRAKVLASGSINGVDADGSFDPERFRSARGARRASLRIPEDALVIGFVGRVVKDKGFVELAESWESLRKRFPTARLLVVGPIEARDAVPEAVLRRMMADERVHWVGEVDDTAPFYSLMDILAFPSHREGFGMVAIEAGAMQVPVVASRIPGCVDSVADGMSGVLIPARRADALTAALAAYLEDPALRARHGRQGRERVLRMFRQEDVWAATWDEYNRLLGRRGAPAPAQPAVEETASAAAP